MTIQILLAALFLAAVLWLGFVPRRKRRRPRPPRPYKGSYGLRPAPRTRLLRRARFRLILRFILGYNINGFEADISCFKAWAAYTHDYGFNNMYYRDFFLDYPRLSLRALHHRAFRRLFGVDQYAQSYTLMIKLAPILSDIACAAALWVLARKKLGEKSALLIAFAYLFCPAVIVNSSVWGQADSFCALLLLCTLLLLWYNHTPLAAFVYGFGILSKPQMLIFAPVLIFWVIRKKDWKNLVLGPIIALVTILLFSTPFIKNFDYLKLIEIYTGTIDYYNYYTINAYNVWALFGLNWAALPEHSTWLQFGVPLATVLAGLLLLKSKRDDAVFACPPFDVHGLHFLRQNARALSVPRAPVPAAHLRFHKGKALPAPVRGHIHGAFFERCLCVVPQ